jgi:hypothetical protein
MTYTALRLVTVSRLFALTVTGYDPLFQALMANFLLPVLWIMFVRSLCIILRYSRLVIQTAHLVELDSGTTKSELRGHDNVVEAAVFIPVSCLPSIRELLGQKVPHFSSPINYLSDFPHSQQQLRVVHLKTRTSRMLRHPRGIKQ